MPVFALANAGVPLSFGAMNADAWRVFAAVVVGLTLGKPLGVLAVSGLALRLGAGTLPVGLTLRHLAVVGVVAGVGFTMALFIAPLAFTDPGLLDAARLGVLVASAAAALGAWLLGRYTPRRGHDPRRRRDGRRGRELNRDLSDARRRGRDGPS
jgi:NhaA family Na+:H+ antiporter